MKVKKTFGRALCLSIFAIFAAFFPVACGGGGGGSGSGASTKVALTGTVDSQVTTKNGASSNPVPNATVTVVDSNGTVVATTTTNASGQYSAQVTKLNDYGVKVTLPSSKPGTKAASDPVTMGGVVFAGGSDTSLNVNPGSTAAYLILLRLFGQTNGMPGTPSTPLPTGNLDGVLTNIYNTPGFAALADAVAADVANHIDPFTDPALDALIQAVINAYTAPTAVGPATPPSFDPLASPPSVFILACFQTGNFFGQVDVGWLPIPGVSGFQVYIGASPDPTDPAGTVVTITNGLTVNTGPIPLSVLLMDHTTYNVEVRAFITPLTKPEAEARPALALLRTFGPWSEPIKFHTGTGLVVTDAGFYRCTAQPSSF